MVHLHLEESSKKAREESLKLMRMTMEIKKCLHDLLKKVELKVEGKEIPVKPTNMGGLQVPSQNRPRPF